MKALLLALLLFHLAAAQSSHPNREFQDGNHPGHKPTAPEILQGMKTSDYHRGLLLRHANRSGMQIPHSILTLTPRTPEQLGWLARTKPGLLSRTPKEPIADWIRAEAIARPSELLPQLVHNKHFSEGLDVLQDTQADEGVKCFLQALALPLSDEQRAQVVSDLYNRGDEKTRRSMLEYAVGQPPAVQRAAVQMLLHPDAEARDVLPWLARPATQTLVLEYLGEPRSYMGSDFPESREPLKRMLLNHEGDQRLVMQALRRQYRMNLAQDRQAWKDWLTAPWPGQQRMSRIPRSQLTGFLSAGWLGTLRPEDLQGIPRLIQIPEIPHDDVLYNLEISSDGHFISFGCYWAYHLPTQTVLYPRGGYPRLTVLPGDRYLLVDESLHVRVQTVQGRVLARWTADHLPNDLCTTADGRQVQWDDKLLDPMTGAVVQPIDGKPYFDETRSPDGNYRVELEAGRLIVTDRRNGSSRELAMGVIPVTPFLPRTAAKCAWLTPIRCRATASATWRRCPPGRCEWMALSKTPEPT